MLACHGVLGHPDSRAEEDADFLELKSRGWGPAATAHTIVAAVDLGFLSPELPTYRWTVGAG